MLKKLLLVLPTLMLVAPAYAGDMKEEFRKRAINDVAKLLAYPTICHVPPEDVREAVEFMARGLDLNDPTTKAEIQAEVARSLRLSAGADKSSAFCTTGREILELWENRPFR